MNLQDKIYKTAIDNYSSAAPWPKDDVWHKTTFEIEKEIVEQWLSTLTSPSMRILNAGSGGTEYRTSGTLIHLDIVENYIKHFDNHLVGSVDNIKLDNNSVDGIISVGSVINYADAQRAIYEFSRVLKPNGFFILEFERSNSAEFLGTSNYRKSIFYKEYCYNEQKHLLWLYSEKHIRQILKNNSLSIKDCKRIHSLSSLCNRLGMCEEKAACLAKYDNLLQLISYPIAHNVLLMGFKCLS